MEIEKFVDKESVTFTVIGRLTAVTAEELSGAVEAVLGETKKLILDFNSMEYLASAGLRVIISAKKKLDIIGGELVIRNVSKPVMDVFELVGLDDVLVFE
ncbi:MAG: STAS domain-containing protein [Spirochaetaceae bacterium]|jgi:anti-sigma B factor antagonist|nr:STAS domain-containing protein [Spirochaetaceae bacterium]